MPQLVSTDTWFPFDLVQQAGSVESIPILSRQYHPDMIMAQLVWIGTSIDYLKAISNTFDVTVSISPLTVRQTIVHHGLKAIVVAVATTEDYFTHIAIGIECLQSSMNVLISPDEFLARHSQLERHRQLKESLWTDFQNVLKPLACKVDGVWLDQTFLLFNPEFTQKVPFKPGTVLCLPGLPSEQKQSFFLEVVELWDQVQNGDIPKFEKAASRLLRVTDHFSKTASYQPEAEEAAAAQSVATDPQKTLVLVTELGIGLEDRENDAADEAESPATVIGDEEARTIQTKR